MASSPGRARVQDEADAAGDAMTSPSSSFVLLESEESRLSPGLLRSTHSDGSARRAPHALHRLYPPTPSIPVVRSDGDGETDPGGRSDGAHSDGGRDSRALRRQESISDLFPMNASVFTNPANIMPTRQASILIDTDMQQAAAQDAAAFGGGGSSHRLNLQPSGTNLGMSSSSILHAVLEHQPKGDTIGHRAASTTGASVRNLSFSGEGVVNGTLSDGTRSHSSFLDGIPPMEPASRRRRWLSYCCKCKWRHWRYWKPREKLASLWTRMVPNWNSILLQSTLALAVLSVPVAVGVAAALANAAPAHVYFRARCAFPGSNSTYEISTATVATVTIPIMNNLVLFIVSLWLSILCSRSRKSVLRSAPCSISSSLTSAFMLPCFEAIWYTITVLSAVGLILYCVSFQAYSSPSSTNTVSLQLDEDPDYPCSVATLPFVWMLQLLPVLMIQRSVSQEAVTRSIAYSGVVCVVLLVCFMALFKYGDLVDGISMAVHILLLGFYFWAKFGFRARATFDFFFVAAVVTSLANLAVSIMGLTNVDTFVVLPIMRCVVDGLDAIIVVAILLALRADTRYWLAIDDGSGTSASSDAMRRYVNLLSERGMITNFSTRTSVYDVHRMIEEHRKNVVDFSALALDCIVAQGATSIVMRGALRGGSQIPIALKIYTSVQVTYEEVERFSRETALNVTLSHPNIVRFFGLCVVPPSISLIFEFCEYGGLDVALRENPAMWTMATKLKAWLDACRAVAYLHSFSPPLLHRDIKTDNFLIGQDFLLKLADFGEANLLRPRSDGTMTIAGTVDYMAPEMIKGGKTARYGTAVDVYSLMITLWQILVPARSPWEAKSHLQVYRCVANGERPPLLPSIPKDCAEILEAGWAPNPQDRVAVEDIIPKVHQLWLLALHQKSLKRTKNL